MLPSYPVTAFWPKEEALQSYFFQSLHQSCLRRLNFNEKQCLKKKSLNNRVNRVKGWAAFIQGYETGCQPRGTPKAVAGERALPGVADRRGAARGGGRAQLWGLVLRIQSGTPCASQLVTYTRDPSVPLGERDCFYNEEISSSTPSTPSVLAHVSFTLHVQNLLTVVSCKVSLTKPSLEGVTWNLEIKNLISQRKISMGTAKRC